MHHTIWIYFIVYWTHAYGALQRNDSNHVDRLNNGKNNVDVPNGPAAKYSTNFIVVAGLGVGEMSRDELTRLADGLARLERAAFERIALRRFGAPSSSLNALQDTRAHVIQVRAPLRVEILSTRQNRAQNDGILVDFVTFLGNSPIPGEIIVKDLSQLSLSHISSTLQWPVLSIYAKSDGELGEEKHWWIISVIIGTGVLVVACVWLCLFLYYNSCGRPMFTPATASNTVPHCATIEKPFVKGSIGEMHEDRTSAYELTLETDKSENAYGKWKSQKTCMVARETQTQTEKMDTVEDKIPREDNMAWEDKRPFEAKNSWKDQMGNADKFTNECKTEDERTTSDKRSRKDERRMEDKREQEDKKLAENKVKKPCDNMMGSRGASKLPYFDANASQTPYTASDQIAAILAAQYTNGECSHPVPALSTETGTLEFQDISYVI